jgi:hypothetical protein
MAFLRATGFRMRRTERHEGDLKIVAIEVKYPRWFGDHGADRLVANLQRDGFIHGEVVGGRMVLSRAKRGGDET